MGKEEGRNSAMQTFTSLRAPMNFYHVKLFFPIILLFWLSFWVCVGVLGDLRKKEIMTRRSPFTSVDEILLLYYGKQLLYPV